jgi:hypothetical protein
MANQVVVVQAKDRQNGRVAESADDPVKDTRLPTTKRRPRLPRSWRDLVQRRLHMIQMPLHQVVGFASIFPNSLIAPFGSMH